MKIINKYRIPDANYPHIDTDIQAIYSEKEGGLNQGTSVKIYRSYSGYISRD
jgi:hypothetical protein